MTKLYRRSDRYEKGKRANDESLRALNMDDVDLPLLHEPHRQGPEMCRAPEESVPGRKGAGDRHFQL